MIIQLTENDLNKIVKSTANRILEQYIDFRDEYITRIPYPIELVFTDHAIERESQRFITEDSVRSDIKKAIRRIVDDFIGGKLGRDEYFKVINRESCAVSVCALFLSKNRIRKIIVITSYIWDGRVNIDKGALYYIEEESPAYIEAKEWNAEHQDIVTDYMDWKRNVPITKQKRKAEREYYYRNNDEIPPDKKMELINRTYDNLERSKKRAIHDALPKGDIDAIRQHFKDMDEKPLASKFSANRDLRAMDLIRKRKKENEKD